MIPNFVLGFAKKEGSLLAGKELSWGCETHFSYTMDTADSKLKLGGRPDYSL